MSDNINNIKELSKGRISSWANKSKHRLENKHWLIRATYVATQILDEMKRSEITQISLADRLHVSKQYISKVLKGEENLTLDTIGRFEAALGIKIKLDIPVFEFDIALCDNKLSINLYNHKTMSPEKIAASIEFIVKNEYVKFVNEDQRENAKAEELNLIS